MTTPEPIRYFVPNWMIWAVGILLVLLIGAGLLAVASGSFRGADRPLVQVLKVTEQVAVREILVRGVIEVKPAIEVFAPQSGKLASVLASIGGDAKNGMPLFTLESEAGLSFQNPRAKEAVQFEIGDDGGAAVNQSLLQEIAVLEKKRAGTAVLVERGFAVPAALERLDKELAQARKRVLPKAQIGSNSGKSTLKEAPIQANEKVVPTIVAPGTGKVASILVKPGDVIRAGQVLAILAPMEPPILSALIGREFLNEVKVGQEATLVVTALDAAFPARVVSIEAEEPSTGATPIRIAANGPIAITGRTQGSARIVLERRPKSILVPRTALIEGPQPSVLVFSNGRAVQRLVRLSPWPGPRALIDGGLKLGERVITNPAGLTPGQAVRLN
jgi:multidrug efflux pump subunit AcrA (membrane-fusion protein)